MSVQKSTECQTRRKGGDWSSQTIMSPNGPTATGSCSRSLTPAVQITVSQKKKKKKEVRCQQADRPPVGRGRGRNLLGPRTQVASSTKFHMPCGKLLIGLLAPLPPWSPVSLDTLALGHVAIIWVRGQWLAMDQDGSWFAGNESTKDFQS